MNTFKRLIDGKIVLDGLVWDTNIDRMIGITNDATGGTVNSIKVDGVYYYPIGFDKNANQSHSSDEIDE